MSRKGAAEEEGFTCRGGHHARVEEGALGVGHCEQMPDVDKV